jgi:hypothetical protein
MNTIKTEQEQKTEIRRELDNQEIKSRVTGEQDEIRRVAAQDALKQLQSVLSQGPDSSATELVDDALLKAEEILMKEARDKNLSPNLKKTLEDLALLVGSAKQLYREKNLGERVNRITEETKKAIEEARLPGVPDKTLEATQQTIQFVTKVRPIFQLLVGSREFRVLIVDSFEILRRIFLRHESEPTETAKHQFLEGENALAITETAIQKSSDSFQNEEGDLHVEISDEEWTSLQDDITRVLANLAQHSTYHQGIEGLFNLIDIFRDQIRQSANSDSPAPESQVHARRARQETEDMIASFSGRKALDEFLESLRQLVNKVDQDERPRRYLSELREFILSTKSAEYVQQEEFKHRSRKLANEARDIVREYKYAREIDDFFKSADQLVQNIRNDEFIEVVRHHAGLVVNDLSHVDSAGDVVANLDMLGKLRDVLLPILAESLKYIPIPRIESSDNNRDYWVDNIVLCGYDVIPDRIRVQFESDSDLSLRDIEMKYAHTRLIITLSQIRTELKDLDFFYKKKTFPEISESGRFSLYLGGPRGATLKLFFEVDQSSSDVLPKFTNGFATFDIEKFDISFDKSSINHDVLFPVVTQLFKAQIQQQIEHEVENSLNSLIGGLGEQLSQALSLVNRPLMSGFKQFQDVAKATEFGQTYEKRQQKLE